MSQLGLYLGSHAQLYAYLFAITLNQTKLNEQVKLRTIGENIKSPFLRSKEHILFTSCFILAGLRCPGEILLSTLPT